MTVGEVDPNSITLNLHTMTSVYVAIATARTLSFLQDIELAERSLLATVVSELSTNIIKYAGKGTLTLSRTAQNGRDVVCIIAEDCGPGIQDVQLAMEDGYSTSGTLGLGLPGVRRIMSTLEIETTLGKGTKVITSKFLDGASGGRFKITNNTPCHDACNVMEIDYAHQVRPHPRETVSGDIVVMHPCQNGFLFGVIDVSGHGREAHFLALKLASCVADTPSHNVEHIITQLHHAAVGTRGAAVGIGFMDYRRRTLSYAGVGNVHIRIVGDNPWRGVSRDGLLGARLPRLYQQTNSVSIGDVILIASDGVSENSRSSFLRGRSNLTAPQFVQEVMMHAAKDTDDVSCVAIKCLN